MKIIIFILSLFLFTPAEAYPKLTGQIVDEANIIHPEIEETINQTLIKYFSLIRVLCIFQEKACQTTQKEV